MNTVWEFIHLFTRRLPQDLTETERGRGGGRKHAHTKIGRLTEKQRGYGAVGGTSAQKSVDYEMYYAR